MRIRTTLAALILLCTLVSAGSAQPVIATGQEIHNPQVAVAGTGDFMIVWSDLDGVTSPTSAGYGVFARLFAAGGQPKGAPFFVPRNRAGDQILPQVAADDRGNFVVVWQGGFGGTQGGDGGDGDGTGVFAQRFDRNGARLGSVLRLSRSTAGDQRTPNVAMASNGSFVAVWQDCTAARRRCSELHAARFTAGGERRGEELEIPVLTASFFLDGTPVTNPTPHVVIEPGGFAVGWTEQEACYKFEYEKFPVILHFTDAGQPVGERYRLDDGDCEDATGWTVAAFTASRTGLSAAFFNAQRNSFQLFAPTGDPAGPRRVVSTEQKACESRLWGNGCESIADAAMRPNGELAVIWNGFSSTSTTIRYSLQAQFFDRQGRPRGGRIEVASPPGELFASTAAFAKDGGLIVVWGEERSPSGGNLVLRMRRVPRS